jgi:DNA-binding NtrC family response regulator
MQVILCDQCMPSMSGTEFMERVKNLAPDTFRIMLSAYTDLSPIMEAINHGAIDRFYTKPWKGCAARKYTRRLPSADAASRHVVGIALDPWL